MAIFSEYRDIIDDWRAFQSIGTRPQPTTIRVNRLRTSVGALSRELTGLGFRLSPHPAHAHVLTVDHAPFSPGHTVAHWLGDFYIQDAAAAVAVQALAPVPGESVLDLCAAPGGKTTQLAETMADQGLVVGNDLTKERMRPLLANVARLGSTATLITRYDGRRFPLSPRFQRVLVDAPCSSEGTWRREGAPYLTAAQRARLPQIQEDLLRAGLSRLELGGVLVYATCTFNPAENEGVVSRVLREASAGARLEAPPDDVPGVPGLQAWRGERFHPDLGLARRIYFHHMDAGGLFLVRCRRVGPLPWDPKPDSHADAGDTLQHCPATTERTRTWLAGRFGVSHAALTGLWAYPRGRHIWQLAHAAIPDWSHLQALGRRMIRPAGVTWKPTSVGLMHLGSLLHRNVVDVQVREVLDLLQGEQVTPRNGSATERGYVALRLADKVLGCGFFDGRRIRSLIPKGRAQELFLCLRDRPGWSTR